MLMIRNFICILVSAGLLSTSTNQNKCLVTVVCTMPSSRALNLLMPRLASSASSDGLILKDLPRVYSPYVKFTDEDMAAPDLAERLAKRDVMCVWHFGDDGVGHPLTVHGGCIAMAFDESFGHAFMSRE